jgi:hypothetical protein
MDCIACTSSFFRLELGGLCRERKTAKQIARISVRNRLKVLSGRSGKIAQKK